MSGQITTVTTVWSHFQFVEAQQTYKMAVDEVLWPESRWDSGSGTGSESESGRENFALMPYYNDDVFADMCTAGPNGMAVYFYLSPHYLDATGEGCASIEENKSSDERETCLPPQNFVSTSSKRDWIISIGISSLQYTLFGMFVLCLNKLRRYHKRRKRLSSSTTSVEDEEIEVSELATIDESVVTSCNFYLCRTMMMIFLSLTISLKGWEK